VGEKNMQFWHETTMVVSALDDIKSAVTFLPHDIALELYQGIWIASERAAWWGKDLQFLPTDSAARVPDVDVWRARSR
jgi:hypothetical protein